MKKIFLFNLIFISFSLSGFSQKWYNTTNEQKNNPQIFLISEKNNEITIGVKIPGFYLTEVNTPKGKENITYIPNSSQLLSKGAPDLSKLTASFIIPDKDEMMVEIISSEYKDYDNILIAPSKGNIYRNVDPDTIPYEYNKVYEINEFFPGILADLRNPYIVRDFRAQTIVIYPFQYNPIQKKLRFYYNMTIKIKSIGNIGKNILERKPGQLKINREFSHIYKSLFLNYNETRYTPVEEDGNMLIISYGPYMQAMQPFINWKITKGMPIEIVDIATIGANANNIKSYVTNYYNTKGLTYLLLVGDAQHIPPVTLNVGGPSDIAYGYTSGNDHYPDLFVGRFSAENLSDVQTQVERTINYEMGPDTTNGWLAKGICIASDEGGNGQGDNGESDRQHQRIIYNKLLSYTYNYIKELYDGNYPGGTDDNGDPSASDLLNLLNNGYGIINYTGHGSDFSFVTTGFSNSNISQLTNNNKLPFIWSVACVNGNFINQTCFAEAWLRATKNGQPTGAIATLMSTINQSWDPPMRAQDEMNDILIETYQNNIKRTFGGISYNGCMKMNDVYGTNGEEMTDTWTCFGDPSIVVRTKSWDTFLVSHPYVLPIGTSQVQISCNKEGAKVAITMNNQILGVGYVNSGIANVSFQPISSLDTLTVCVTDFNYKPYIGNILIITPNGPYIVYNSHSINDTIGNNNGQADYGENLFLNITLKNVGTTSANNIIANLTSNNNYITITDSVEFVNSILPDSMITLNNAFSISINNYVPDNTNIPFLLKLTSDTMTWIYHFSINVKAPLLTIGNALVNDNSTNNNHTLDPGETANIIIPVFNNGGSTATNTIATLQSNTSYITITNNYSQIGNIPSGNYGNATFSINVNNNAPRGSVAEFSFTVNSGPYAATKNFTLKIGIIQEDFETGTLNNFPWINAGDANWFITTEDPYEGQYCLRSGQIGANQYSELKISFNIASNDSISFYRKVSCEDNPYGGWWDYLQFDIDGEIKGRWDGQENWKRFAYPVSAGLHTFKWTYIKDGFMDDGQDCAWLDYIIFPPIYDSTTGIIHNSTNLNLIIYPNPATNSLTIIFDKQPNSNISIKLISSQGKIVKNFTNINFTNNSIICNLNGIKSGLYFLVITDNNETITRPIIIN